METLFHETAETARRLARTCNPQTSKDAAVKMVESGALNRQQKEVYEAILAHLNNEFTAKELSRFGYLPL